jgi:hypothetical protein
MQVESPPTVSVGGLSAILYQQRLTTFWPFGQGRGTAYRRA